MHLWIAKVPVNKGLLPYTSGVDFAHTFGVRRCREVSVMTIDQRTTLPPMPPGPPMPPVPPLNPGLPVPIAMVEAGLKAWAEVNPADLPPETALLVTQVLANAHDQTKALTLTAVADVERRELFRLDDCTSTGSWIVEQVTSFDRDAVALARKV